MKNNIDQICANAPELQAYEGLDAMPCSASDLFERWEKRIRTTPERAKSGGVDYVGGLIDAYGTCLHELREFLEQNTRDHAPR